MTEALPAFRYHPDPRATGSVVPTEDACGVCGARRGLRYEGPVYAEADDETVVCPWCIADGSAAEALGAEFTDVGTAVPPGVPDEVLAAVARRTPGFSGWQQDHWLFHCGDAAAFLGPAGRAELDRHPDALEALRREGADRGWDAAQTADYLRALGRDDPPTAYLFACLHCRAHLAYTDAP